MSCIECDAPTAANPKTGQPCKWCYDCFGLLLSCDACGNWHMPEAECANCKTARHCLIRFPTKDDKGERYYQTCGAGIYGEAAEQGQDICNKCQYKLKTRRWRQCDGTEKNQYLCWNMAMFNANRDMPHTHCGECFHPDVIAKKLQASAKKNGKVGEVKKDVKKEVKKEAKKADWAAAVKRDGKKAEVAKEPVKEAPAPAPALKKEEKEKPKAAAAAAAAAAAPAAPIMVEEDDLLSRLPATGARIHLDGAIVGDLILDVESVTANEMGGLMADSFKSKTHVYLPRKGEGVEYKDGDVVFMTPFVAGENPANWPAPIRLVRDEMSSAFVGQAVCGRGMMKIDLRVTPDVHSLSIVAIVRK